MALRPLHAVFASLLLTSAALAADMTVVVNRNETTATLYVMVSADALGPVFGEEASQILPPPEDMGFADLQLAVFDRAGMLMSEALVISGGQDARFEGMSMVFHPASEPAPFATPWEASLSASLCTQPDRAVADADDLTAYARLVMRGVDATQGFTLSLPVTGRAAIEVELRDFVRGKPLETSRFVIPDGGQLKVASVGGFMSDLTWFYVPVSILALMTFGAWRMRRRAELKTSDAGR